MPIEKRKASANKEYESNNSNWSSQLTWWVVVIWIVLVIFIIFTFSKFNTLTGWNKVQDLERKITTLEWEISALKKDKWSIVYATYEWWSSTTNNVKRIWERSFWFPAEAEWKDCYILWSKLNGADGWTVRWYLGARYNWSTYQTADSYEAQVNNWEQKINDLQKYQADVFVMGDDWKGKFDFLKHYCDLIACQKANQHIQSNRNH